MTAAMLPSLADVRDFMSHGGWTSGEPGPAGSLWHRGDRVIAVPLFDDPDVVRGVVERLATSLRRPLQVLIDEIRYFRVDVTNFKAEADSRVSDSIPLQTAVVMTSSARSLLRSAGTTALRPHGDLKGKYSRLSDDLISNAKMGHTKQGSFVIPIIVPLPDVAAEEQQSPATDPLIEISRVPPEPYERRAMRTLAQSLKAVREVIVDPAVEPTRHSLHAAVELGVSREFCTALNAVLSQPAVGDLEADFTWAGAVRTSPNMPAKVQIPSDSQQLIKEAATKLRELRIEPARTYSGTIVELRHIQGDPYGHVTIATVRNGHAAEIRIKLPYEHYLEALRWHREVRAVLVSGEVSRDKGRLAIEDPASCHPIDELYITGDRS